MPTAFYPMTLPPLGSPQNKHGLRCTTGPDISWNPPHKTGAKSSALKEMKYWGKTNDTLLARRRFSNLLPINSSNDRFVHQQT